MKFTKTARAIDAKYNCGLERAEKAVKNTYLCAEEKDDGTTEYVWRTYYGRADAREHSSCFVPKNDPNRRAYVRRARNRKADALADFFRPCLAGADKITRENYFRFTAVLWHEVDANTIAGLPADFESFSGSAYFETDEGVYRRSNHWGARVRTCSWFLDTIAAKDSMLNLLSDDVTCTPEPVVAYAPYSAFISKGLQGDLARVMALAPAFAA